MFMINNRIHEPCLVHKQGLRERLYTQYLKDIGKYKRGNTKRFLTKHYQSIFKLFSNQLANFMIICVAIKLYTKQI